MVSLSAQDRAFVIWWVTPLECQSALRRQRQRAMTESVLAEALERLSTLTASADVVDPSTALRDRAGRLLSVHGLRTAEALQLAAALAWSDDQPRGEIFICLDRRLRDAAQEEGYTVLPEAL